MCRTVHDEDFAGGVRRAPRGSRTGKDAKLAVAFGQARNSVRGRAKRTFSMSAGLRHGARQSEATQCNNHGYRRNGTVKRT